MTVVDARPELVAKVVERAGRSVVRVGRGPGRGGGIVVADGLVLTNSHNLRGEETTLSFTDGHAVKGQVRGIDADGDLAVIEVDTDGAPALSFSTAPVVLGEPVLTLGVPVSGGTRVTLGTVSATGRSFRGPGGRLIPDGIEHTAPLPRGSSGSPLLDREANLVGLNTHRIGEGFYLALPTDEELRRRIESLRRGESVRRLRLGIQIAPPPAARRLRSAVGLPEIDGLLVRAVEEGGLADAAGIRPGDLLVEVDGQAIRSPDDLFRILDDKEVGASILVALVRGADELEVLVGRGRDEGGA